MINKDTIKKIRDGADIIEGGLRELTRQLERLTSTLDAVNNASSALSVELDGIEDE